MPSHLPIASAKILGIVVFWVVVLLFLSSAIRIPGLNTFTSRLSRTVDYLPAAFVGAFIVIASFLVSQLAREVMQAAVGKAGIALLESFKSCGGKSHQRIARTSRCHGAPTINLDITRCPVQV